MGIRKKRTPKRIAERTVKENLKMDGWKIIESRTDEDGPFDILAGRDQHFFLIHINHSVYPYSLGKLDREDRKTLKDIAQKLDAFPCVAKVKLYGDLSVMDLSYSPIK
jgi:hypothetical protein